MQTHALLDTQIIFYLFSLIALARRQLEYNFQICPSGLKKGMDLLRGVQEKETRTIGGLESVKSEEKLKEHCLT